MDIFADKTVFIAGAATDLGWRLLPLLAKAKARVILMDEDGEELTAMAQTNTQIFEPLHIDRLNAQTCSVVGRIWGDEPIDVLLDFTALSDFCEATDRPQTVHALLKAFEPALMSADGGVVSVIPQTGAEGSAEDMVAEAGLLKLAESFGQNWHRWRVTYNVLRPEVGASAIAMTTAVNVAVQAGWDNFTGVHIPIASAAH